MKPWVCLLSGLLLMSANHPSFAAPKSVTHILQNDFTALCVVDSVLVAAGNNSICTATFDKQNMQFLPAELSDYPGPAKQIKLLGDVIAIQSQSGVLTLLSTSALPDIQVLDQIPPVDSYRDFTLLNGQLFLACGFEGLRQYQLAGNGSVVLVDSSLSPVHAVAMTSATGHIYVADDYAGLVIFEPTAVGLGSPTLVPISDPTISVTSRNDTVFSGSDVGGISLFRMTGDSLISLTELPTHVSTDRIELADSLVLSISADGRRADLVSLSGHTNPIAVDSIDLFFGGSAFLSGSDILFVAPTTTGDLSLYDLGRFESGGSQRGSATPQGGTIAGVGIANDKVIVSRQSQPSLSFSFASQSSPTGSLIFPGLGGMTQVVVAEGHYFFYSHDDQTVYLASKSGSDLRLDTAVTLYDSTFESIRVTAPIHDSLRLLSILAPNSIELYRIGPDWSVRAFARQYLPERPIDVVSIDTFLAVGCRSNVYVFSVSDDLVYGYKATIGLNQTAGQLVRLLSDPSQPTNVSLVSEGAVVNYDLSTPSSPSLVGSVESQSNIVDAVQSGDFMYLATIDNGVLKVHSPNGSNPTVVDSVRILGDKLAVSGSTVAIASNHGVWVVDWSVGSDVRNDEFAGLPSGFRLDQNYPNPFNPETHISYELTRPGRVELTVYNLLGQPVRTLVETTQGAGSHTEVFDSRDLASGVYFYRLTTSGVSQSRKMVLVK